MRVNHLRSGMKLLKLLRINIIKVGLESKVMELNFYHKKPRKRGKGSYVLPPPVLLDCYKRINFINDCQLVNFHRLF